MIKHLANVLALIVLTLCISACQNKATISVNPSENAEWELVKTFDGHKEQVTERFHLNGNPALIKYKVKSTKKWTHSSLDVYLGDGSADVWQNPDIKVFNQDQKEGKVSVHKPAGSYLLFLKALEVHYHLEIYQKNEA